jgi:hypothetical protein
MFHRGTFWNSKTPGVRAAHLQIPDPLSVLGGHLLAALFHQSKLLLLT